MLISYWNRNLHNNEERTEERERIEEYEKQHRWKWNNKAEGSERRSARFIFFCKCHSYLYPFIRLCIDAASRKTNKQNDPKKEDTNRKGIDASLMTNNESKNKSTKCNEKRNGPILSMNRKEWKVRKSISNGYLVGVDRSPSTVFLYDQWQKAKDKIHWSHLHKQIKEKKQTKEKTSEHEMFIHIHMRMLNCLFILCCH